MTSLEQLTELAQEGVNLDTDQAKGAVALLASAETDPILKGEFLTALADKGETAIEVAAFAETLRGLSIDPGVGSWAGSAIDIVGTGGDHAGSFNISTTVSFILAASGVPVFKHGNRSITSKCGSADLIEGVGIQLNASHELLRQSVEELNFCFFFAPAFHPAFKEIMPVRKALAAQGKRTIFNILGPLINPGKPAYQLLGVFSSKWVSPLAGALSSLGLSSGLVVHGRPAEGIVLDELSCAGVNEVAGIRALAKETGRLTAEDAGLPVCEFSDLKGGDVSRNLEILGAFSKGDSETIPSGLVDSILLNAGAAFWILGRSEDLQSGVAMARETVSTGKLKNWLDRVAEFYADHSKIN
ncbi:MAG: anthranilate phosphoribosyltransferase [Verrucomicrobiota bacterium]